MRLLAKPLIRCSVGRFVFCFKRGDRGITFDLSLLYSYIVVAFLKYFMSYYFFGLFAQ